MASKTTLKSSSTRPTYKKSTNLESAITALNNQEKNKPGEYKSQYGEQIDTLLSNILNNKKFSYDFNADPMYQQYKNQFVQQGQAAMKDTAANAASLTGGYGNSYATSAAAQSYQTYLNELNNVIPELRNQAYTEYNNNLNQLSTNLQLLKQQDDSAYGKYRDNVSDYNTELSYLYQKMSDMSDDEYNKFLQTVENWNNDRNYNYQLDRDKVTDSQWQQQFDESKRQYNESLAASKAKSSSSSGSSGSGSSGSGKSPSADILDEALNLYNNDKDSYNAAIDKWLVLGYDAETINDYVLRNAKKTTSSQGTTQSGERFYVNGQNSIASKLFK